MILLRRFCALVLLSLAACEELPPLDSGVCGNAVIEKGEDCDSFPLTEGTVCLPAEDPAACRLSCRAGEDGTRPPCPPGWGCGLDGLCRQPSGAFASAGSPIPAGAWSADIGDFDGDGRKDVFTRARSDLVGTSRCRIHYFNDQAPLDSTLSVPIPMVSPVIANLHVRGQADPRDDVVTGISGLLPWLGSEARTLFPVASPSFEADAKYLRLLPVKTGAPGLGVYPLVLSVSPEYTIVFDPSIQDHEQGALAVLGDAGLFTQLAGDPVIDRIDERAEACDGFVVAFRGRTELSVFRPCHVEEREVEGVKKLEIVWHAGLSPLSFALPGPIGSGARFGDVNLDGHLDLLVGTLEDDGAGGHVSRLRVAYGNGQGRFSSTEASLATPDDLIAPEPIGLEVEGNQTDDELELPLAVGDITGDFVADYVFPTAIYLSTKVPGAGTQFTKDIARLHGRWTQAFIVDLNGNELPDVIASSAHDLDLEFYNGYKAADGTAGVVAYSVQTNREVPHMVVGDFDGDLVNDVMFSQPQDSPGGADGLYVAFGSLSGPPLPATKVGEMEPIVQVTAYGAMLPLRPVAVLSSPPGDTTEVTLLFGTGERLPLAPRLLTNSPGDENEDFPMLLTVGPLLGDSADVFTLAVDPGGATVIPTFAPWIALGGRGAVGKPFPLRTPVPFQGDEWPTLLATGDLDGDGKAELVIATLKLEVPGMKALGGRIHVGRLAMTVLPDQEYPAVDWTPTQEPFDLAGLPTSTGRILVEDLEGDGAADLVLTPGDGSLRILWNDGAGRFSNTAATVVREAGSFAATRVGDRVGEAKACVCLSDKSLVRTRCAADRRFEEEVLATGLVRPTGLTAGDLNGDGVEDLALVDSMNLLILRGKGVNP